MSGGKKVLLGVTSILVVLSVVLIAFGLLTSAGVAKKEKKAMLILPGLFGSGLMDTRDGSFIWDNFEGNDEIAFSDIMNENGVNIAGLLPLVLFDPIIKTELDKILANDGVGTPDSLLNMIAMNSDSTPRHPSVERVPWSNESRLRYGVANSLKEMWTSLNERYGDEYDVQVFNYDFRLDVRYNAEILEEYINEQGYTEVILMGHSNGGPVINAYLARSEENRKKVSKFVSFNAPLLGSFSAIGILENVDDMLSGLPPAIHSLTGGKIQKVFDNQFKTLVNMYTPYQLLPSYEAFQYEYMGERAGYYLDGERLEFKSQEELYEFYCSRPWAKDEYGNLKVPMQNWMESRDCFYVEQKDGSKVLACKLVDTTYINGTNVKGGFQTHFVTDKVTGEVNLVKQMDTTMYGDGTVVTVSAIGGQADEKDIVLFDGHDHYTILFAFDKVAKESTYEVIDQMLASRVSFELIGIAVLLSTIVVAGIAGLLITITEYRKKKQ